MFEYTLGVASNARGCFMLRSRRRIDRFTEDIAAQFREARSADEAARRRRARLAELNALGQAFAMVFTGLFMATLYLLI
jgi:hypothetical protein